MTWTRILCRLANIAITLKMLRTATWLTACAIHRARVALERERGIQ